LHVRSRAILAGLGLALGLGGTVFAAPVSVTPYTVSGSAPQICAVSNPVLTAGALVNFQSLNGTMLQLSKLADSRTLATNAASATVTFAAVCNYPHQIILESQNNGLYRDGAVGSPPPSGFADGVPYTASLTWGSVTSQFFVAATTRQTTQDRVVVPAATAGNIQIQLTIQAGASNLTANAPLIAGTYTDTLRITVEPQ
jgi:hypothetical protein